MSLWNNIHRVCPHREVIVRKLGVFIVVVVLLRSSRVFLRVAFAFCPRARRMKVAGAAKRPAQVPLRGMAFFFV